MGLHDERIEPEGRRWQRHYWRGKCPVQAVELALIQYGPQVQIEIVSQGLELVLTALLLPFICGEVALDAGKASAAGLVHEYGLLLEQGANFGLALLQHLAGGDEFEAARQGLKPVFLLAKRIELAARLALLLDQIPITHGQPFFLPLDPR